MTNTRFKLGKLAPRHDKRTFQFKSYLTTLPPLPAAINWGGKVSDWLMLGNGPDSTVSYPNFQGAGDCTCAAAAHLEMGWSSNANPTEIPPTAMQILTAYSAITGYDPSQTDAEGNNPTDTGADLLTVLNYWRAHGVAKHGIKYYTQIGLKNKHELQASIALMGGAYIGINLPQSAEDAFQNNQPWTDTTDTNILGGHAICLVAYDSEYVTAVTWGATVQINYLWLATYMDEAYSIISPQWIEANGSSTPGGFNLTQLEADLKVI